MKYGFEVYKETPLLGGTQTLFRFPNNYGASVIEHSISYGTELAVIKFREDAKEKEYDLDYSTDITDDVLGNLGGREVEQLLERIKNL